MISIKILQSLFIFFRYQYVGIFFLSSCARQAFGEKETFFFSQGTQYNNNNIFIQPTKSTEGLCF